MVSFNQALCEELIGKTNLSLIMDNLDNLPALTLLNINKALTTKLISTKNLPCPKLLENYRWGDHNFTAAEVGSAAVEHGLSAGVNPTVREASSLGCLTTNGSMGKPKTVAISCKHGSSRYRDYTIINHLIGANLANPIQKAAGFIFTKTLNQLKELNNPKPNPDPTLLESMDIDTALEEAVAAIPISRKRANSLSSPNSSIILPNPKKPQPSFEIEALKAEIVQLKEALENRDKQLNIALDKITKLTEKVISLERLPSIDNLNILYHSLNNKFDKFFNNQPNNNYNQIPKNGLKLNNPITGVEVFEDAVEIPDLANPSDFPDLASDHVLPSLGTDSGTQIPIPQPNNSNPNPNPKSNTNPKPKESWAKVASAPSSQPRKPKPKHLRINYEYLMTERTPNTFRRIHVIINPTRYVSNLRMAEFKALVYNFPKKYKLKTAMVSFIGRKIFELYVTDNNYEEVLSKLRAINAPVEEDPNIYLPHKFCRKTPLEFKTITIKRVSNLISFTTSNNLKQAILKHCPQEWLGEINAMVEKIKADKADKEPQSSTLKSQTAMDTLFE